MAWRILMHAFKMIFSNWQEAIKLSFVPFALVVVLSFGLIYLAQSNPFVVSEWIVWGVMLVSVICSAWIAVNWHRFVLLEEYPKAVPSFPTKIVLGYLWQSIKVGAPLIVAVFAALLVTAALNFMLPIAVSIIFMMLVIFIGVLFAMRLGITLPAASLGQKLTLKEALQKTDHLNGAIIGIVFLMLAVNVLATMVMTNLVVLPVIGVAIYIVFQWFSLLLGASLLTTLYGIAVEGRELRD